MKLVLQSNKTGRVEVADAPPPTLLTGGALVRNHYSLLSAGTERGVLEFGRKGMIGKARSRPDLVREVINKARTDGIVPTYRAAINRLGSPIPLGYSSAGEVLDAGPETEGLQRGALVACAGAGYASHAEVVSVPKNLLALVPQGVSARAAAFATIGSVALQGIRRADLTPGERVAVIGLGLVGQLTVAILSAYGYPVLGLDVEPKRANKATVLGAEASGIIGQDTVQQALAFSRGIGVDAVLITAATESSEPVELAAQLCRDRGRVSVIGDVGMDLPRRPYYEKELDLRLSRSYGPGRYDPEYEEKGYDYPLGYVRWTEQRNMEEVLRLISAGRIDVEPLITHTFPIEQANQAYDLVLRDAQADVGAVMLEYAPSDTPEPSSITLAPKPTKEATTKVTVGLIGAGNFARSTILPALKQIAGVDLRVVAAATGTSALHAGRKFGAEYTTTNYHEVLGDDAVGLVVIATRHHLHAQMAIDALERGKDVYVEKPLALSVSELRSVARAARTCAGRLTVGFNRRFAPLTGVLREQLAGRATPLVISYTVYAGAVPPDSWLHDPQQGGGRVIGEVCHFVDLLQHLAGGAPQRLSATQPSSDSLLPNENASVVLDFADGSRGSIIYTAMGAPSMSKERLELFWGRQGAALDNFRRLELFSGSRKKIRRGRQDKGHAALLRAACTALEQGGPAPIPLEETLLSSLATLKIPEAVAKGAWVAIDPQELASAEDEKTDA